MKNKIIRTLKRRELYVILIAYPAFFILINKFFSNLKPLIEKNLNYYGWTSFLFFSIVVVLFAIEIVSKLYGYGLQGDKLRIREKEGVDIKEINNAKRN